MRLIKLTKLIIIFLFTVIVSNIFTISSIKAADQIILEAAEKMTWFRGEKYYEAIGSVTVRGSDYLLSADRIKAYHSDEKGTELEKINGDGNIEFSNSKFSVKSDSFEYLITDKILKIFGENDKKIISKDIVLLAKGDLIIYDNEKIFEIKDNALIKLSNGDYISAQLLKAKYGYEENNIQWKIIEGFEDVEYINSKDKSKISGEYGVFDIVSKIGKICENIIVISNDDKVMNSDGCLTFNSELGEYIFEGASKILLKNFEF